MQSRFLSVISALAVIVLAPSSVHAQNQPAAAESIALTGGDSGSARSKANDWMIMPGGTTTFGGTIQFVTAQAGLDDERLRFTDLVMLSLQARRSFMNRFEIFGSASFLPKQPSYTDELLWQGASLGARIGAGKRYAGVIAFAGGPLLRDRGMWSAGAMKMQARKSLHDTLVVEGGIGSATTVLFEERRDKPAWLTEATASAELVFRDPRGMTAGWIGTEFRVPIVHDSTTSDLGEEPYDPQTRVNVHIGMVLSYIPNWDIFAKYMIVDRGDYIDASTTLPILEGGFDQRHFIIGLTRRFKAKKQQRHPDHYIAE